MDKKGIIVNIVQRFIESPYDPQSETAQISDNLDIEVEDWRRHVTITLKNRDLFEEVLILVAKDGYVDSDTIGSKVYRLTKEEYTTHIDLSDNRYVTARVGKVYVPILFLE